MPRTKHAVASRRRKKRVLKLAKGQFGQRSKRYQQADRSIRRGLRFAYRDRKVKKREFRALWSVRINAACREAGITYSRFINGLKKAKIELNRQMLAELAVNSPTSFQKLVKLAQG
jgi:large subunit ribosomal protein L20